MAHPSRRSNRKRSRRSWWNRLVFCGSWFLGTSIVLAIACIVIYGSRASQFDLTRVAEIPAAATIYDTSGREITTLKGGRQLAARDELPQFLVDCLLAREDARFFEHGGVDWKGLIRATLRNIKDRSFTQGASTLTMQLARNTFSIRAKSIDRKLLEIAITKRIETVYSKNEILTYYLNRIYFGSGCYGIASAAEKYFNRDVSELSEGQCALLVGIIRGPHIFSPFRNLDGASSQRNQVLNRLIVQGKLNTEQAAEIKAQPLYLHQKQTTGRNDKTYAVQAARRHLNEIVTDAQLSSGGLAIRTTLDLEQQARIDGLIDEIFLLLKSTPQTDPAEDLQCAAVTIDVKTGAIRALTGGRDFSKSKFNRALDARRTVGPAFEVFLNALARERGKLPISGKPVITARQLGEAELISLLPRLGLKGPYGTGDDIARGTMLTTPLQLATALATLNGGGQFPRTYLIQSVETQHGDPLFRNSPSFKPVMSRSAADEGLSALEKKRLLISAKRRPKDIWIFLTSGKNSTVLWFGYDQPKTITTFRKAANRISSTVELFSKNH